MLHLIKMLNSLSSLMGFKNCCSNLDLLRRGSGMKSLLRAAALSLHPSPTGSALCKGLCARSQWGGGFCHRITECLGEQIRAVILMSVAKSHCWSGPQHAVNCE